MEAKQLWLDLTIHEKGMSTLPSSGSVGGTGINAAKRQTNYMASSLTNTFTNLYYHAVSRPQPKYIRILDV